MSEAPERYWRTQAGGIHSRKEWVGKGDIPYIRADLVPQWQPIETAPKDGRRVLLWEVYTVPSDAIEESWSFSGHWSDGGRPGWKDDDDNIVHPTHWMPLPSPPEAQTENDIPRTSVSAAPHLAENDAKSDT